MVINHANNTLPEEISLLISFKALIFCPLMIFAIYMFRRNTYQILTLITPFALIEFLHIKYDSVYLAYEYYLIFMILALLCVIFKAQTIRRIRTLKLILIILIPIQLFTGYWFLANSSIPEEKEFITMLINREPNDDQRDNRDIASLHQQHTANLPHFGGRCHRIPDSGLRKQHPPAHHALPGRVLQRHRVAS